MIDISAIASNLVETGDGLWVSKNHSAVSYPQDGMDFTYQLEEQSYWFIHRNHCITTLVDRFRPVGPLFDVGGGNGFVSQALRNIAVETVLVEPDPAGSRHALERRLSPVINAALSDAGFIPESMDAVGLFDVLEHIEDDGAFLRQIHTLVKPGGRLFVTVPAYSFLWSVDDVSAGHFRRYTLKGLNRRLNQAGFRIDFATYIFFLLPLPITLFRALPSRLGWRKEIQLEDPSLKNEYVSGVGWVDALFNPELHWISRLRRIPFGGSCLIAASRVKNSLHL